MHCGKGTAVLLLGRLQSVIVFRALFSPRSDEPIPDEILHPKPPANLEPGVGFVIGEEEVRFNSQAPMHRSHSTCQCH